jgi:hypothetical protein
MLSITGVNVSCEKAFDRPRELAVEPVDENGFEDGSLKDEIGLAYGRVS